MKIFSVSQIRAWDAYTIANEPIPSWDLMERASLNFVRWFCERFDGSKSVKVFCGTGNNGGDGLAVARLLLQKHYPVQVFAVKHAEKFSDDFQKNLTSLELEIPIKWIENGTNFPQLFPEDYVIDALLGSGLSRPTSGVLADVIQQINNSNSTVISIDIASGLFADSPNLPTDIIVKPDFTVSFQCPKLAFFQPQYAEYVGQWHVLDIGLGTQFEQATDTPYHFITSSLIDNYSFLHPRKKYAHKGTYGHALLLGGSYGKIGAMVLSSRACLRSGVGLLSVQIPRCGYDILQTSLPEAMVVPDWHWMVNTSVSDISPYTALGVGPGMGKDPLTLQMLKQLLPTVVVPLVLDADALNLIGENPDLFDSIPKNAILTPHPKEFQRLLGRNWNNDYEKLELLRDFTQKHQVIVCLKGAHTAIAAPNGAIYFNSTGNPGMATGGSGDVLTGIITGLLAQGIAPMEAAIFGVYQHGLAGDRAAQKCTQPAMIASDIINEMGW
jgi:ADP-dependent NAD(P)H-hydrate dehydratase / NAD(P)H-hydrate epimerase